MTVCGDLDVSVIDELRFFRQNADKTAVAREDKRDGVYSELNAKPGLADKFILFIH